MVLQGDCGERGGGVWSQPESLWCAEPRRAGCCDHHTHRQRQGCEPAELRETTHTETPASTEGAERPDNESNTTSNFTVAAQRPNRPEWRTCTASLKPGFLTASQQKRNNRTTLLQAPQRPSLTYAHMSLLPHLFHLPCALRQRAPAALALARVAVGGGGGDTSCRSCKHTYAAVTPALCRKVASPGASSSSPSSTQSAGQHHSMSSFRTSSGGALLLTGAHQCSSSSSCHTTTTQQQPLFFSLQQHSWGGAGLVAASTSTSSLSSQCWQQQQQHHGRQRSRCTWPAFASLSANSGIGELSSVCRLSVLTNRLLCQQQNTQ